jgi:hypothetical protein
MKTYEEWCKNAVEFNEYVFPKDEVDQEIYNYFAEVLPPQNCGYRWFLLGEAVDSIMDKHGDFHLRFDLFVEFDGKYFFFGPVTENEINYGNVPLEYERYESAFIVAVKNGWEIDVSSMNHNGPHFSKNGMHIWKIRDGWQCADLEDGVYKNHRPNKELLYLLEEA